MNKKLTLGKVCLTYALCGVITLQPVFANVVIDGNSGNTSKTAAVNGVEVINIATPNSQGLSHNKYQRFDVDPSGLILNNSTEALSRSQLGGILQGNPHLNGKAANVILNEVTGANRSQLEGYTEVFGQQANVILANPYGITCDGCGFINTPRVTLSTGTPEIKNGLVSGFDVAEGSVTIEGLGLDATRQTYFDIISRTAEINANIHANDLSMVTGVNKVEYQTNKVTEKSSGSATIKPKLAIDSSSIGGMYAGRISLVATEDGVGVNVGNLSSSQGDITIDADGNIVLGRSSSTQSTRLSSNQEILLTETQSAGSDIFISANQVAVNNAKVVSGRALSLESSKLTLSDSTLESKQLLTKVADISLDQPSSVSSVTAQLRDLVSLDNQGKLSASDSLSVEGDSSALSGAGSIDTKTLKTQTNKLTLDTVVTTESAELNTKNNLVIGGAGKLSATQDINIVTDTLQLDGELNASNTVNVKAEGIVAITGKVNANNASLNAKQLHQHGEVKAATTINLNAVERFEQSGSGVIEAGTKLTINADDLSLGGRSQSNKSTAVKASKTTLSGEHRAVDDLTVAGNTLDQGAMLAANKNVSILASGKVTNTGNISAGQVLTVNSGSFENDAQFSAKEDVQITVNNELVNKEHGLITGQNTTLAAASIHNTGSLQALKRLGLNASSLTNTGAMVSGVDVITQINTTLENRGVIYASNDALLYSRQLNNYGDILAKRNITIAKNEVLDRSDGLLNSSASIETLEGNISIFTGSFRNTTDDYKVDKKTINVNVSSQPGGGRSSVTFNHRSAYAPEFTETSKCVRKCSASSQDPTVYRDEIKVTGRDRFSYLVYEEQNKVSSDARFSRIIAGSNMAISADSVENQTSMIHGENVSIDANSVENTGQKISSYKVIYDYKLSDSDYYHSSTGTSPSLEPKFTFIRTVRTEAIGTEHVPSTISAVGNVDINAISKLNNSEIKPDGARVIPESKAHNLKPVEEYLVAITPSQDSNSIRFPDFKLPTRPNGLFVYSNGPKGKYLVETNPLISDLGLYLGSDYFRQSVGFNPESDVTFLGDAYYDTRAITQTIFEQTGQRYLNAQVGSDLAQMQNLIDAAAKQKNQLDLKAGVALSEEQIAKLTDDIIWYEPVVIEGIEVLAPKLYIANLTERDFSSGAVIAGKNIDINAGDIENSGSIKAEDTLALTSKEQILNDTGSLKAGGDLIAEAKGNIQNLSGSITGDNIALISHEGDIINKTLSDGLNIGKDGNWLESDANASFTETFIGDTATISANKELVLKAGDSIENKGATIKSGKSATLIAEQDIRSTSIQDNNYLTYELHNVTIEKAKTEYQDSLIRSGGTLNVLAGGDLEASGGELSASENTNIEVSGDITLLANQTYELDRYDAARKKDVFKNTRQNGVKLNAGRNLSMRSGNNVTFVASELNANNDISLTNSGQFVVMSANETDYSRVYRESRGFWGKSTSDTEISTQTAKGTSFNAENITLVSGETQLHQASVLSANNDIYLESTRGSLVFKAAQESESYRHETKKSGFKIKMQGQGHTSTSQAQTSMESGGNISLASALGMEVDYVSTDNNLAKALAQIPADGEFAWIAELKDNPNVNWNEVNEAFDSWSYSESSLSGPAAAIIAIALTVVTAGAAAGAGAALASATVGTTSAAASTVAAVGAAATSTLITQASLSLINNNGDLGATLDDLGSSAKVKQLATTMVTAGALSAFSFATGVTDGTINPDTGLANSSSVDVAKLGADNPNIFTATPSFTPESLLRHVGKSSIRAGVDSTINGTDFGESFTNSLRGAIANDIGALAANEIGDISSSYGFENGGFTKTTLHAISQGAVAELAGGDFEAGAAAGAAVELTGDIVGQSGLSEEQQVNVSGLIGATAGVISTGDAEGAYTGQNTGGIVHRFNHLNHQEKTELEFAKKECNGGDQSACNRRDELNQLDYERNASMQTACSVGSTEECQAQIDFAQANYDSYEGQIGPFDDVSIGNARLQIDKLLINYDQSYDSWDTKGMKDFGYAMLTEPEGIALCAVVTLTACKPLAAISTLATGVDIADDVYSRGADANYYQVATFATTQFADKTILSKIGLSDMNAQLASQILSKTFDDLADKAYEYDQEE
ncbi:DUF637 domain-containing protein [Vibrio europaeus]|uniref:two-partner secretion domain-containing protein n=1 Tax=Vibrio europaeus TaxID=300876 RepID=UPI002340EF93|nr:DUF637 domain-containing protein [Vibrio europaeus]MDC5848210.1 DUF637 domain-containing protein [Vibrio europaeus]